VALALAMVMTLVMAMVKNSKQRSLEKEARRK